jgi:hypothetical protein
LVWILVAIGLLLTFPTFFQAFAPGGIARRASNSPLVERGPPGC